MTARIAITCLLILMPMAANAGTSNSCDVEHGSSLSGFIAGANEKTLRETYYPTMTLPIRVDKFVALLKSSSLDYEVMWSKSSEPSLFPRPMHAPSANAKCYTFVYQISDPARIAKREGAVFAAYVDRTGRVVYVENQFQYDGP
jgi:hypothetical protein